MRQTDAEGVRRNLGPSYGLAQPSTRPPCVDCIECLSLFRLCSLSVFSVFLVFQYLIVKATIWTYGSVLWGLEKWRKKRPEAKLHI